MVKMPSFFTAAVAISARLAIAFVARASAMAPLVMAVAAFFMGAMAGISCRVMML